MKINCNDNHFMNNEMTLGTLGTWVNNKLWGLEYMKYNVIVYQYSVVFVHVNMYVRYAVILFYCIQVTTCWIISSYISCTYTLLFFLKSKTFKIIIYLLLFYIYFA